jgi:hypothetical protein
VREDQMDTDGMDVDEYFDLVIAPIFGGTE